MRFYLRAISYFREDLGKIIASFALVGVAVFLDVLQPIPLAILIDWVFVGSTKPTGWMYDWFAPIAPAGIVQQVMVLAVGTLLIRLVQEVLKLGQTLLNLRIGYNGSMRVRCDLFRKLQELSLAYHKSQPQGDAIYRLSYDTYGCQTILDVVVKTVIISSVTLLIMAWIMFSMSWQLTLISLSVAPFLLWTTKVYARILRDYSLKAKEFDTRLMTTVQRSVATIGLVQAFGRETDEYDRFHTSIRDSVGAYMRLHWQEMIYWLFVGNIFGIGGALIFGYGGYAIYRDQMVLNMHGAGMTVGKLSIFLYYLGKLYGPLNALSSAGASIAGGVAGVQRVFEVLDRDPIIKDAPDAVHLPRQSRVLQLQNVVFEYRPGQPVLSDVSCTIKPGSMVAFVGSSGVGKTTLLNLLPRFYDPSSGCIRLDDCDLRKVRVKDVRRHIALVLQESVVLPTTVGENIAYGRPDASDAQVRHAAELAGAHEFIMQLPAGYDEQVSESGQNLSGGQKQRISIARALLTEAPVIVMDEPTSALDPHHEQLIIETLKRLKGQRTIILVSHRLSTVADCDRIFVMQEGRIAEQGSHDELVARRGLYYSMAKHQMKLVDEPAPASAAH
jgi:subfamily B ATP-binding cassette protein MsbA